MIGRRAALLLLLAALSLFGFAGAAPGAEGDNSAVAINERDGSSIFTFAFSIKEISGEVVDQTNAAVAYSSCEACQTVAVAIQVLIVTSSPDTIAPENYAVAVNENCTSCVTAALAYQFVVGNGGPVRLTAEGRRRLALVRREFARLRKDDVPIEEILARVEELRNEVRDVLANELVARGDEEDEDEADGEDVDEDGDEEAGETDPQGEGNPEATPTGAPETEGSAAGAGEQPPPSAAPAGAGEASAPQGDQPENGTAGSGQQPDPAVSPDSPEQASPEQGAGGDQ